MHKTSRNRDARKGGGEAALKGYNMHKEGGIRLVGEEFIYYALVGAPLIDQHKKEKRASR